jgi:hypothetical protein
VKGRILAGWAQKSLEPWPSVSNYKIYIKKERKDSPSIYI